MTPCSLRCMGPPPMIFTCLPLSLLNKSQGPLQSRCMSLRLAVGVGPPRDAAPLFLKTIPLCYSHSSYDTATLEHGICSVKICNVPSKQHAPPHASGSCRCDGICRDGRLHVVIVLPHHSLVKGQAHLRREPGRRDDRGGGPGKGRWSSPRGSGSMFRLVRPKAGHPGEWGGAACMA